jgi:phosphatidylserine/phosphatidylglycerophosphate/cardiolipin synthase-like enzyme
MTQPPRGFFVESVTSEGSDFRAPARPGCEVIPLIDRVNALREMERAILAAKRTVALSGWIFITDTPLQDDHVRSSIGGSTWLELLTFVATRPDGPVTVRLVVSDFDPVFEVNLHRLCWRAIADLASARERLPTAHRDNLQFFPSQHGAVLRRRTLRLFGIDLHALLARIVKDYNKGPFLDALVRYVQTPGHWSSIHADRATKRFALRAGPRDVVHLAIHHQKLCLVDGETAFCGGMDVTDLALNDRAHRLRRRHRQRRGFDLLWHDIHCRVRGPAVFDIERNFVARWNDESARFRSTVLEFAGHLPEGATLPRAFAEAARPSRSAPRPSGPSMVQVHRTVSVDAEPGLATIANPAAGIFETVRQDILDGYLHAIGRAARYVYFENQYFRSTAIAQALVDRRKASPHLKVIVVLPVAPEEFKEGERDPRVLHPIALQGEIIETLTAEFGADIGFFSLVAPIRSALPSLTHEFGSPQIYVHSKVCIVDDLFATIGSANVNGRSFLLDTELNVAWLDPGLKVRDFRVDLWSELLGVPRSEIVRWDPEVFVARWGAIASANARTPPRRRSGFVIEHNSEKFRKVTAELPPLPTLLEAFLAIVDLSRRPAPPELIADPPAPARIVPIPEVAAVS